MDDKPYIVLYDKSITSLEERVNSCIQEGYIPLGGVFIREVALGSLTYQAMYRSTTKKNGAGVKNAARNLDITTDVVIAGSYDLAATKWKISNTRVRQIMADIFVKLNMPGNITSGLTSIRLNKISILEAIEQYKQREDK